MKERRRALLLVVAVFLMVLAYAFAATNTVPASRAGDGEGAVTGYTVSNVHYTLDTNNPSVILGVQFDLDAAAGSVYAALSSDGTTWTWSGACTNNVGNTWECTFPAPGIDVKPTIWLRVVAAD